MKVLELFSGTASFSKCARERGYETFTVDMEERFKPDLVKNVLDLTVTDIPFKPDIIWASPPCQCFSVASIYIHWTGGDRKYIPKTDGAKTSIEVVRKTVDLINEWKEILMISSR